MRRRTFITLLAGATTAMVSPCGTNAQSSKIRRIGTLLLGIAYAESFRTALHEELRKAGYVEGRNLRVEFHTADRISLLPKLASELVALKVDVIVAVYAPCALAAQQATREIPVVVVAGDLLDTGLVESLSHPGRNITGVSLLAAEAHGKCIELFRELLPSVRRVAVLGNAADPFSKPILKQVRLAGITTGIEIVPVTMVREPNEIDRAFAAMKQSGGSLASKTTADLALKRGLAAATFARSFAEVGGLMSYGADVPESFRRSAVFVAKMLHGAKPADLPVEQPEKFELIINVKTATALGLTVPPSLLQRADQVIE